MADNKNTPEYKGPGKITAALGQSTVDGIVGSLGGAAVGAVVGAVAHTKIPGAGSRGSKALWAASIGSFVVGGVAGLVGLVRGWKKVSAAREQLEQVASDNQQLQQKLAVAEESVAQSKSFIDALKNERAQAPAAGRGA